MPELTAQVSDDIELCYESYGDSADPTILLIMGLGGPMGWWSVAFCESLAARGFFVVRYDNRDVGRSSRVKSAVRLTRAVVVRTFVGASRDVPYTLSDLAADGVGLLDHLGVRRAHVVGVSMGGMIAQTIAIEHADRVLSLTSIMATTGRRTVGWQHPGLLPMFFRRNDRSREAYVAASHVTAKVLGSPGYPADAEVIRARAEETFDRGWEPLGVLRQTLAVISQPDRTSALRNLRIPACVIHGTADRLVHPSGGRATAAAIPGAELVLIPGMGHDLPPELDDVITEAIARTAARASVQA
ncbi:MAG: Hydrolase, alpha/beta fold family [uncultured Nocardioidaceae bacterium]|uniref:Hydrolase, alpha/beta fold family n=1 Tax=uncultured Nocardioidaceae bacterium TaxID=253824 RepID=A0A6J4M1W9_9ACTN|nr:MAG: Hydrolase, alpha/beta fold family [uncultured Nocardioidaceae bacterium]